MSTVLVLEDTVERVSWLRDRFPELNVIHATNPLEFVQGWDQGPSLIILDHDLGLSAWDGYEACKLLPELDLHRNTPVLIWSQNPVDVGQRRISMSWHMAQFLQRQGFTVFRYMFGIQSAEVLLTVARATRE